MNSFSTPNIIFNINYSSSSNKFNNIISSLSNSNMTINSIGDYIRNSILKSFISFSKSFLNSKTALNSSFFISLRPSILTRSNNNFLCNSNNIISIIFNYFNSSSKTIIKTIVICYMMINSIIVNFMIVGMTVKIEECFFFCCCKSLMISIIKFIRLSTII